MYGLGSKERLVLSNILEMTTMAVSLEEAVACVAVILLFRRFHATQSLPRRSNLLTKYGYTYITVIFFSFCSVLCDSEKV